MFIGENMNDADMTKKQMLDELMIQRKRIAELEVFNDIKIQRLLDSLPFYVLLVDSDHEIIMANKAVTQQLGVKAQSIIGGYCPKLIHGLDHPYPNCPLEESVKNNCAIELEYFDQDKNKWFASAIYPSECKTRLGKTIYFHMVHDITNSKNVEHDLKQSLSKFKKITDAIIQAAVITIEKRDPYTAGHQQRVSKLAYEIATEMKLTEEQIEGTRISGLIHDMGKIGVPIEILCKPGEINIHEYNIIKIHSQTGYEILSGIEFPWPIAEIVLQHHERINGSGYPRALLDKDILIEAKILAVADVVEAMCSHRPYRPARSINQALEEILKEKGILYEPNAVDACLKLFKEGFDF
jgi:PAS domain S-box-containing protein